MRSFWFIVIVLLGQLSCLQEDPEAIDPIREEGSWEHIDSLDGLSPGYILDVYFDGQNYWAASTDGLSLYDGEDFYLFTDQNVLPDNYVTSIAEDADGAIWFGTAGGASIFDGTDWYVLEQIGGFDWEILCMEQQQNGDLLIGTSSLGIIIYDGSGFLQVFDEQCNDCNFINTLYEDSQSNVWVGSAADLKHYNSDLNLIKNYKTQLSGTDVQAIHETRQGQMWVGFKDSDRINVISNGELNELLITDLNVIPVYAFASGPDDQLWVGTLLNDLLYFDGAVFRKRLDWPGSDRYILAMKTIEDQIYIGTDDGIFIYTLP